MINFSLVYKLYFIPVFSKMNSKCNNFDLCLSKISNSLKLLGNAFINGM